MVEYLANVKRKRKSRPCMYDPPMIFIAFRKWQYSIHLKSPFNIARKISQQLSVYKQRQLCDSFVELATRLRLISSQSLAANMSFAQFKSLRGNLIVARPRTHES